MDFFSAATLDLDAVPAAQPLPYSPEPAVRRRLGAYYTPGSVAEYMADWAVRFDQEHVLEPSFGDGTFLHALSRSAARRQFQNLRISAVELDERALIHVVGNDHPNVLNLRCEDFLRVAPFRVHSVLGNPPYVRLRHLEVPAKQRALDAAERTLGYSMDPSGSLWMPFVLHSMRFLAEGGRLAFVLPYELTYVRYAQPLWRVLGDNFGSLQVLRSHERLFPELMQDVIVLFADGFGECCSTVTYKVYSNVSDLLHQRPASTEEVCINGLLSGQRGFVRALLPSRLRHLLDIRIAPLTRPARDIVTFNIGYVSGDKDFFHPTPGTIREFELPQRSLRPALTSTRAMRTAGLWSSALGSEQQSQLFLPSAGVLTKGEQRYIADGTARGVSSRYKCRVRAPWYVVPGIRVPDLFLSVFAERPKLMMNDGKLLASNSLLCGFCTRTEPQTVVGAWYTSLTLLMCELEVHALGGGVMVMVPGEAGNVRLPTEVRADGHHLAALDGFLRREHIEDAYRHGDKHILTGQLGITPDEVELLREGIGILAHWRTAGRTTSGTNGSA
jgi:hypothetical protein